MIILKRSGNVMRKSYYIGGIIGLILGMIMGGLLGIFIGGCNTIPGASGCKYAGNYILTGNVLGAVIGSILGALIGNWLYKIKLMH